MLDTQCYIVTHAQANNTLADPIPVSGIEISWMGSAPARDGAREPKSRIDIKKMCSGDALATARLFVVPSCQHTTQ